MKNFITTFPISGDMNFKVFSSDNIPYDYTEKVPKTFYDVWNGEEWEFSVEKKTQAIENHIYKYYTRDKQGQDSTHQSYSQTVIIGLSTQNGSPVSLDELSIEIMGATMDIYDGKLSLEDYLLFKDVNLREHYEKLTKIGLRLKWTKICIDEGKQAIAENRDFNFPAYKF